MYEDSTLHPRITRSQYLWFDVEVSPEPRGTACAEIGLLAHGMTSPVPERGVLTLLPSLSDSGWSLNASWAGTHDAGSAAGLVRGHLPGQGQSALEIAEAAYGLVHRCLMAEGHARGYSRLHAALLDVHGSRVMLAGPTGSGKTSLAMALTARGALIHSDEGVLLREGLALGLPRRIHVKHSGLDLVQSAVRKTLITLPYSPPVYALDPLDLYLPGTRLVMTERRIDHVVLLGDPDAETRVSPVTAEAALWPLLTEASDYGSAAEPVSASRSRLVAELATLLSAATLSTLQGHHGNAGAAAIVELVTGRVAR